jgi:hypothetical protein
MSIQDSINCTIVVSVVTTLWFVPVLLYYRQKPNSRNGHKVGPFDLARPMTAGSVQSCAMACAIVALALTLIVVFLGYLWFLGIAAYACLWFAIMIASVSQFPQRFHTSLRLTALGSLLLAVALGIGWTAFCRWVYLPLPGFVGLCASAVVVDLAAAFRHIPDR